MHSLDPAPYILAAAALAFPLGYLASHIHALHERRKIERASWRAARRYYVHLFSKDS